MDTQVKSSVLDRLRKLQRLTRSSNEHEAALAAAKMQEILFAHNLSLDSLRDPSAYVEEGTHVGARLWARRLIISLCETNFCRPIAGSAGEILVIGRRDNVAAVNAMFVYLVGEINRLAGAAYTEYRSATPWPETVRTWSQGFRNGAVTSIGARLRTQRERDVEKISAAVLGNETGTAIIRRLDQELSDEVVRRHPRLVFSRTSRSNIRSLSGYQAGHAAGSQMSLRPTGGHLA